MVPLRAGNNCTSEFPFPKWGWSLVLAMLLSVQPVLSEVVITPAPSYEGLVTLSAALDHTLMQSPRAAAARALLGITKASYIQAFVLPNPGLEFDYGWRAEHTYRKGFFVPIEGPWKMFFRLLAARANVLKAALSIQTTLWALRGTLRRAYTELVIAEETAVIMRELQDITHQLTVAATVRYNLGDTAKIDVYRAQLAESQAQIAAEQAERRIITAREQLNIVMARPEQTNTQVPRLTRFKLYAEENHLLPDLDTALPPLSDFLNLAMQTRLEIRSARQDIKVAQAELRNVYGEIIPDWQIDFGRSIQTDPGQGPTLKGTYMMGTFALPIFDFQQGNIAKYKATIRQAQLELRSQQNIVRGEVQQAYRKVWNERETIRRYQEKVLAESEKVAELGRTSYKLGLSDITAALTAQQSNIQIQSQYLAEIGNYQQAFTDLEQSVGRPLQ